MSFEIPQFSPALPEIFILSMACFILLIDLVLSDTQRVVSYLLTQFTLLMGAMLTIVTQSGKEVLTFSDTFVVDPMAVTLKTAILLVTFLVFLYSQDYLRVRGLFKGEYFVIGLFGVLGMMVMVSAHSLLTIYLGLELLSLSLYALVAFQRDSATAAEAAMKYFVLGALASGMLLYGMSMLYGAAGTLDIARLAPYVAEHGGDNQVLVFGLVFIVIGLAFKLGAVPFHMWIPDVYHGAPTSVTLYLASAPKIAAFALAIRLLVDGMGQLSAEWQDMLIVLSILSMAIGNIVAIAQENIKRMLAYSTISHVGFLLLGILSGTPAGYSASMFYALVYALMSAAGFGVVLLLSRQGFEADKLEDFKGLNNRNPWFALMMMLTMFSMAGVPPTVGFYAKLLVIQAVVAVDMVWLATLAVILSIIGAFYYLRIVKLMYFDEAIDTTPLSAGLDMRTVISVNGLALLGLGIFPGGLMGQCNAVFGV
jgi:NADH-quinone oxidoreductase subunit N